MALLKFTRWSRLVLKVLRPGSPQTFVPVCSINAARGINFNANVSEDSIPDCDDLEKLQWLIREKISLSADVTGSGKVHKQNVKGLFTWLTDADARTCQVVLDDPDPDNLITFEGDYHLTTFSMNGDPGTPTVSGDISLQSTGEVTATFGDNVDVEL